MKTTFRAAAFSFLPQVEQGLERTREVALPGTGLIVAEATIADESSPNEPSPGIWVAELARRTPESKPNRKVKTVHQ